MLSEQMFWVLSKVLHKKKKKSNEKSAENWALKTACSGRGVSGALAREWEVGSTNRGPGDHITHGRDCTEGGVSAGPCALRDCSSGAGEEWAQAHEAQSIILQERSLIEGRKNGKTSGVGVVRVPGISPRFREVEAEQPWRVKRLGGAGLVQIPKPVLLMESGEQAVEEAPVPSGNMARPGGQSLQSAGLNPGHTRPPGQAHT